MITNSKVYDRLKFIVQVVLPGLSALYFSLSDVWGLPDPDKVVGTFAILATFLGLFLHKSSQAYKNSKDRFDGTINQTQSEGKTLVSIDVDGDPLKVLAQKDELSLRVNKEQNLGTVTPPKAVKKAPAKKTVKKKPAN